MSVKVKICGITNLPDAQAAVEAGADAIGFVFYERSVRRVSVETAAGIARALPNSILKAGVFVNAPEASVFQAHRRTIHLEGELHEPDRNLFGSDRRDRCRSDCDDSEASVGTTKRDSFAWPVSASVPVRATTSMAWASSTPEM